MWIRRVGGAVKALAYAPDGRTLYTVEGDRVSAWDIASREPARLFRLDPVQAEDATAIHVIGGRYLRVRTNTLLVWDLLEGRVLAAREARGRGTPADPATTELHFITAGGAVRSCDLLSGKARTLVRKPRELELLRLFAFSPDRRRVAMADNRRTVILEPATGKVLALPQPEEWVYGLHFTAGGSVCLRVAFNRVEAWDAASGEQVAPFVECAEPWAVFALNPVAPIFVALDRESRYTLFHALTGEALRALGLPLGREPGRHILAGRPHLRGRRE